MCTCVQVPVEAIRGSLTLELELQMVGSECWELD